MDVLALISNVQKGRTASLPSWISLRDIQQHKTQWRCFVPKCLCVLSSHPLFQTFRDFLAQLYRLSMSGRGGATMLESFIFNLVEEIPLPASNLAQTSFRLVDRACLLTGNAPGLPALYPTEVDFTILFQCLSPENILKVAFVLLLIVVLVEVTHEGRPCLVFLDANTHPGLRILTDGEESRGLFQQLLHHLASHRDASSSSSSV